MAETWRVFESEREANVFGLMILPESGRPEWLISFRMNGEMTVERQREIANKVAALPDLLEALDALSRPKDLRGNRTRIELAQRLGLRVPASHSDLVTVIARAALAKAEGRS